MFCCLSKAVLSSTFEVKKFLLKNLRKHPENGSVSLFFFTFFDLLVA